MSDGMPHDIIGKIKDLLGFPKARLSRIFKVTRPTLNAHLSGRIRMNKASVHRYDVIDKLYSQLAAIITVTPGSSASVFRVNGTTLFAEMERDELDINLILEIATKLDSYLCGRIKTAEEFDRLNPNTRY